MKRILILILAAAATGNSCKKDENREEPSLQVTAPAVLVTATDRSSMKATHTAGSYTITVMSNATWTAAVEAVTLWCTATPASGTGNSAVRIDVEENPALTQRNATITFAAGTLTKKVTVTQDPHPAPTPAPAPTPPHAASTQTWTLGAQTWSDAIHMPDCNKPEFASSEDTPQCRSHTDGANTWYYYNWIYLNTNKAAMCPDPWRMPTRGDFTTLSITPVSQLIDAWSFGGFLIETLYKADSQAYYWSDTESGLFAYCFSYHSIGQETDGFYKSRGLQVRCVR
jgi:hypothetical protein